MLLLFSFGSKIKSKIKINSKSPVAPFIKGGKAKAKAAGQAWWHAACCGTSVSTPPLPKQERHFGAMLYR